VRLRPLTEAECYARCYGGRREETVSFFHVSSDSDARRADTGEQLEEAFEPALSAGEIGKEAA
jgi:hypothetical protein